MPLGKFVKSPEEVKRYAVEYVDWLDTAEYLQSATITATPVTTNPLIFQLQAFTANDTDLSFFVTGGVAGTTYKIVVHATTTNGQVKEDVILLEVRSI